MTVDERFGVDDTADSPMGAVEIWMERFFTWAPYATLVVAAVIASVGEWDPATAALAPAAMVWTWVSFSRLGRPTKVPQAPLRIYFVGFFILGLLLMARHPVFLIYGISGFYHAALLRPWWVSLVGVAAAGVVVHATIILNDQRPIAWLIYIGIVAIQTVAVWIGIYGGIKLTETADERRETVRQLEKLIEENEGLHAQLVSQAREAGVLDERQRMAREIHDTIAQGLTGVITQLEAAHQSWSDEAELKRRVDLASEIARDSLAEARRSVQAIRPGPLDNSRLPEALEDVAVRWAETSGVGVEVHVTGDLRPLHPEVEVTLLRATQEALANIAKHAEASRSAITLSFMDNSVALDVRDDGKGFDVGAGVRDGHYGLAAMRQRVEALQGVMEVESGPSDGTAISINVMTGGESHV